MSTTRMNIDNIEEVITHINERDERKIDWKAIEQITSTSKRTIQRRISDAGYEWSRKHLKYLNSVDMALDEIAVTVIEKKPIQVNKGENEMEDKNMKEIDMSSAIAEITKKVTQKQEYKAMTVYFKSDIYEALNKFAKESPNKKAKQEAINDMMELFLKQNNYL